MSLTVATTITTLNTYLSDTTNDRISAAERLEALTEATVWLNEELGNDHAVNTYKFDFLDTVNYYKITNSVTDLLESADLRRAEHVQRQPATPVSSREMAELIGRGSEEFKFAIERRNSDSFIAVTLDPLNTATQVASFDSLTGDGGEWLADTTGSDALNPTADTIEYAEGSASLNFDVDVSQSGNNYALVYNDDLNPKDLTAHEDLGAFIFELYIPDVTYVSSTTLTWGSSSTAYWAATVTTDIDGAALTSGWNTIKVLWSAATMTSTPDVTAINYISFKVTYTGSQTDDTDFRIDDLRVVNPEELTFYYNSWNVGTSNVGAPLKAFAATTDVPFYSGKYDQYRYAVAHKAASILFFYPLRLQEEGMLHEKEATAQVERLKKIVPKSTVKESHSFKVHGVNFNRRQYRRTR
jgi:hypothetical protein